MSRPRVPSAGASGANVAGRVHGFEGVEESTARGMLESGSPVQVVVNTIGKQRLRRTA